MEGRVFILITVPVWKDGPVLDVSKVNTTVIAGRVYTRVGGWSTNVKTIPMLLFHDFGNFYF